jgi:3-dehydroquinate synthase
LRNALVITDSNVSRLHKLDAAKTFPDKGFDGTHLLVLPAGEETKSVKYLSQIYETLVELNYTRSDAIIAFGGGVIGDLAGFAASTFMRGIELIHVPTTLLAMIDSSLGGKTAINLPSGKNLVGTFYDAQTTHIDTNYLSTLPPKVFSDGMAEAIKHACIADASLFQALEKGDFSMEYLIAKNREIKEAFVQLDPQDKGERMKLNFGHTIGHAVEQYGDFSRYTHGEAVAIGMYAVTLASERNGMTAKGSAERVKNVLIKYNLPYELEIPPSIFEKTILLDKKTSGDSINIIFLEEIGKSSIKKMLKHSLLSFFQGARDE